MEIPAKIAISARMYRRADDENLWQGDMIESRKLIDSGTLFGHQDYMAQRDDFPGFCVVTQTCDLVRDEKGRRSPVDFICLSVIRRLTDVFSKESAVGKQQDSTKDLLRNIINHDYTRQGYFYLPSSTMIEEDCVIDLRTTFSLHAEQHYDQVLKARELSLTDVYANKLGWMVGNIFSRVPTPEWDAEARKQRIKDLLDAIKKRGGPRKLPREEAIFGLDAIARDPNITERLDEADSQKLLANAKCVLEALERRTGRT